MNKRIVISLGLGLVSILSWQALGQTSRVRAAEKRVKPGLQQDLRELGLDYGAPVYFRAFKEERELELWVQERGKDTFRLFRTYAIAGVSGRLGPKLREGDRQMPEGFYFFKKGALNPQSSFHLAFNIGYPNAYDRTHGRTGSLIMVHGRRASVGCYAMTDPKIEEIYTLVRAAFAGGQSFIRFHSFPFRMTAERLVKAEKSSHAPFWANLQQGYDFFEKTKRPPNVEVVDKEYVFD